MKISALVALKGKMSRRKTPPSKGSAAGGTTLLWVPCTPQQKNSDTLQKETRPVCASLRPQRSIAASEGEVAYSNCWRVQVCSSDDNGVNKRTVRRSCTKLVLPATAPLFFSGGEIRPFFRRGASDRGFPKEARGPPYTGPVPTLCLLSRLLRDPTSAHGSTCR